MEMHLKGLLGVIGIRIDMLDKPYRKGRPRLSIRVLMHEHFTRNTVYLGIQFLRFFGRSYGLKIRIPFYYPDKGDR